MIDDLFLIEKYAYLKSPVHSIDARAKIVLAFSAIITGAKPMVLWLLAAK